MFSAQFLIAVVACCTSGALGGFALAKPRAALAWVGLDPAQDSNHGLSEARAFGGMLLVSHFMAAWLLGYMPGLGANVCLALALLWAGAALGRIVSVVFDRTGGARSRWVLVMEVMTALALSLPWWAASQSLSGPSIIV